MQPAPSPEIFDYFSAEYRQNPYPFYALLREKDPVHWGISFDPAHQGMWHVARYQDILQVHKDPRFTHRPPEVTAGGFSTVDFNDLSQLYLSLSNQSILFADPPLHTRLRRLVGRAFTPRMVEGLRPRVEEVATGLLQAASRRDQLDIIKDFALPLTITIIAEMLGVPPDGQAQLSSWAAVLVRAVDCKRDRGIYEQAGRISIEIFQYFTELLAQRRQQLGSDLLSQLLVARDQGDQLNDIELIVTATTLLIAGHETTVNLIGNGVLSLLRCPDQLALLRQHPELAPGAVEEVLRFESSSQMTSRYTTTDVEVGGTLVRKGQILNLLIGSGNRDPEVFREPDRFDITRKENRHLAFGMGMHYCLGAPLARLEGQVALRLLLQHFPRLRLRDPEPHWRDTISFRGLQDLVVVWDD